MRRERIRETGWLKAWRSDNLAAAKADQDALTAYGIKSELLDRQAISALEPNILPVYSVGLLHTQTASVDSPGNVVKAYAKMLSGSGGEVRRAEIKSISPDGDGWRVVLSDGELRARHVVVALGPWSADLLRPLGYRVPLATERGYHREYRPNPSRKLLRPIHDAENAFLMTPMENGIRVTSRRRADRRARRRRIFRRSTRSSRWRAAWSSSASRSATPGAARVRPCRTACR